MDFFKLLVLSATLEAVWQTCKLFWQAGKVNIDMIGAAILGVLFCMATKVDFFSIVGIELYIPYIGYIASGLLISRGANFVHNFIASIENLKNTTKT